MERDEKTLIRLSVSGDANAFRALLDIHYMSVYKMAFHLCGHREDAEDITQLACIKISQNIMTFQMNSKFTTWIYTIVLNTYRDWVDNRANTGKGKVAIGDAAPRLSNNDNPENNAAANEQLRQLSMLPQEERETVILVFAHGLSHKEAAKALGCAESTVSWRVHEVRKKLVGMKEGSGL
jgi:RNA polymerase sigma-70 factor (ECF subfamily)